VGAYEAPIPFLNAKLRARVELVNTLALSSNQKSAAAGMKQF
jgi:hypothetical protein